jgi:NUMOD4 motif./AP2 domain.
MEVFKSIEGYPNYEISNLGNVKSLKYKRGNKAKNLIATNNSGGYLILTLVNSHGKKSFQVHQLVAIYFLGHKPCGFKLVVNHKDFDRHNNNVENLEIVSMRENTNQKHLKSTSKYTGVSWHKHNKKWMSCIVINKKLKTLGYFHNEYDAYLAYEKALKELI